MRLINWILKKRWHNKSRLKKTWFILEVGIYIYVIPILLDLSLSSMNRSKYENREGKPISEKTLVQDIDEMMVQYNKFNGVNAAVLVKKDGRVIFQQVYNHPDTLEEGRTRLDRKYYIGSVSKQFAAVSLLLLEEKNKLKLEQDICSFLDCPEDKRGKIKIIQILNHTAGFGRQLSGGKHFLSVAADMGGEKRALEKIAKEVLEEPLASNPGEKHVYSNIAYHLAAKIVEIVSEQSYSDFLKKEIFSKLQMMDSGHSSELIDGDIVELYTSRRLFRNSFSFEEFPSFRYANYYGAGDIYSTLDDLSKWGSIFKPNILLKGQALEKLITNYIDDYGLGIAVEQGELSKNKIFWHNGHVGMSHTEFFHYPAEDITVVIFSNNTHPTAKDMSKFFGSINNLLREKKHVIPIGTTWY